MAEAVIHKGEITFDLVGLSETDVQILAALVGSLHMFNQPNGVTSEVVSGLYNPITNALSDAKIKRTYFVRNAGVYLSPSKDRAV